MRTKIHNNKIKKENEIYCYTVNKYLDKNARFLLYIINRNVYTIKKECIKWKHTPYIKQ